MARDHWRTRVKGGVLRRDFLRYAGRAIGWVVTVGSGALAGDFLAARREQATAKPGITGTAAVTLGALTAEGPGSILAPPASLSASGTVSRPPA
jgi:hypothetical protein